MVDVVGAATDGPDSRICGAVTVNGDAGKDILPGMTGPDYGTKVMEAHRETGEDVTSGTSAETVGVLTGATGTHNTIYGRDGVTGARGGEFRVHSIRAGNMAGDRPVPFSRKTGRAEPTHKAISREAFADGCAKAIRRMAGMSDGSIHNMDKVLGL